MEPPVKSNPTESAFGPIERGEWTSASSAEADSLCPGRHTAQKGMVGESTAASEFGQAVHASFAGDDVDLNMTQERLLELAEEREEKVLDRYFGDGFQVHRELRLWTYFANWKHSGQADRIFISRDGRSAGVEDLKSLRGNVAVSSENMQLRDLAVLVWLNFRVEEVVCWINQPMVSGGTQVTRYNSNHLFQAWASMRLRISLSNNEHSGRVPGHVQCQFCRARGVCKESLAWVKNNSVEVLKRNESAKELAARITPDQLKEVWEKSATITSILEAVKQRLLSLPDDELSKIGLARKSGYFRESISDYDEIFKRLVHFGATDKEIMSHMKMTKAELEKLVRKITKSKGRELDATIDRLLTGITDKKQTSDTIVTL